MVEDAVQAFSAPVSKKSPRKVRKSKAPKKAVTLNDFLDSIKVSLRCCWLYYCCTGGPAGATHFTAVPSTAQVMNRASCDVSDCIQMGQYLEPLKEQLNCTTVKKLRMLGIEDYKKVGLHCIA